MEDGALVLWDIQARVSSLGFEFDDSALGYGLLYMLMDGALLLYYVPGLLLMDGGICELGFGMTTLWSLHVWCTCYQLCSYLDDDIHELGFVPRDCAMTCCYNLPSSTVMTHLFMSSSTWFGDGAMARVSLAWRCYCYLV